MKACLLIFSLLIAGTALGKITNPSLYRIEKPGSAAAPSYILGTIHSLVQMDEFEASLRGMIYRSRLVLTELALTPEEVALFSTDPYEALAKHTNTPEGETDLTPDVQKKLVNLGMPLNMIAGVRDRDCGILYGIQFARSKNLPLDIEVTKAAHFFQIPNEALDTVELRNEAKRQNTEKSKDGWVCSLNYLLAKSDGTDILADIATVLNELADKYRLGKRLEKNSDQSPLLTVRNQAWLPKIESEIDKGGTFIAVGQSHLYGKLGILQMLKSHGYRIQRITSGR